MSFSRRNRTSMPVSSSLYTFIDAEPGAPSSGFLNRKVLQEAGGKKSKDRHWQTVWGQIKEKKLELYKVSGISIKPHGEAPPKDIYPPPNRQQTKLSSMDIKGASLEIDYSSQRDKDLDKRRRHLFRLTLDNGMECLFQAASEHQMMQWVANIKRHTLPDIGEGDEEGDFFRIKASRCSINKKSKHNTNSVRVIGRTDDDSDIGPYATSLSDLDPRLHLLKERLQRKRELIKHLDKMMRSFSGDTACMYREVDPVGHAHNRGGRQSVSSEGTDSHRTSKSDSSSTKTGRTVITKLLGDYYLLPGVEWSMLKKGEKVEVLQRLPNGWYRCRAIRTAEYRLPEIPQSDVYKDDAMDGKGDTTKPSGPEEEKGKENGDEEEGEKTEEEEDNEERNEEGDDEYEDEDETDVKSPHRLRTDSYMAATTDYSLLKSQAKRNDSYKVATRGYADSVKGRQTADRQIRHLSLVGTPLYQEENPQEPPDLEMIKLRVRVLINSERHNTMYNFPLIGCIPASVLSRFAKHAVYKPSPSNTSTVAPDDKMAAPPKAGYNELEEPNVSLSQTEEAVPEDMSIEGGASSFLDISSSQSYASSLSPSNSSIRVDVSSPIEPTSDTNVNRSSTNIDIMGQRGESGEDGLGTTGSMLSVGSVPSKMLRGALGRSLDISEVESLESSLDKPRQGRAASLPVAVDDEVSEQLNRLEEVQSPDLDMLQEEEDNAFEVDNPPRRRKSSRSLKVVPSPNSTLERKKTEEGGGGGGGGHVSFKEPTSFTKSPSKSKQRTKSEDIHKKGLLGRIRSNLLGHKKKTSNGKPPAGSSLYDVFDDDLGDMRSRVTSITGKAVRARGMEVTFGDSSSESDSEEPESKSTKVSLSVTVSEGTTPLPSKNVGSEALESPTPDTLTLHESLGKSLSSPVQLSDYPKPLAGGGETAGRKRSESRSFSARNLYEGSKILGYIQAPPKRVKRHIYLDPTESRFGLHLECYEVHMDQGKIPRAIVQHVVPGSAAFVAGLYPGDQILKINDIDVSQSRVSKIVNLIQNTEKDKRLELVVAYVDGVHRLEVQSKSIECRETLRDRQKQLSALVSTYGEVSSLVTPPFSPVSLMSPSYLDVSMWAQESLSDEEPSLHIYPYDRRLNKILALSSDDVTQIPCDMLVVPLRDTQDVQKVLRAGGERLMDELGTAEHCSLGENIVTGGYNLRAQVVCHAVFGDSEDDIVSCCRSALETAFEQHYKSIVFWIEGFISAAHVTPKHIISSVRDWLEEGDNRTSFDKLVFNVLSTPAIVSLIERYFPLEDYERDERIASLNYCTDSEDEDDEIDVSNKRLKTRQRLPSGPPPSLPPKPSSSSSSLVPSLNSNVLALSESSKPVSGEGGPFSLVPGTEGSVHSTIKKPSSPSKPSLSPKANPSDSTPHSPSKPLPPKPVVTPTHSSVAPRTVLKSPPPEISTAEKSVPPLKSLPVAKAASPSVAPKPPSKSPPSLPSGTASPTRPTVAPKPTSKSPPPSPARPSVAPKPTSKSPPPSSPTRPSVAPKPVVRPTVLKSPPPELIIATKSYTKAGATSPPPTDKRPETAPKPSTKSPSKRSPSPSTSKSPPKTPPKPLLSPERSASLQSFPPSSLPAKSSISQRDHPKPMSKDSFVMNLTELDSIMSDLDQAVASLSNSQ